MTKKDYIAIANALNPHVQGTISDTQEILAALCAAFSRDNSRFDYQRFLEAATKPFIITR
jgi:hypothetical protein